MLSKILSQTYLLELGHFRKDGVIKRKKMLSLTTWIKDLRHWRIWKIKEKTPITKRSSSWGSNKGRPVWWRRRVNRVPWWTNQWWDWVNTTHKWIDNWKKLKKKLTYLSKDVKVNRKRCKANKSTLSTTLIKLFMSTSRTWWIRSQTVPSILTKSSCLPNK